MSAFHILDLAPSVKRFAARVDSFEAYIAHSTIIECDDENEVGKPWALRGDSVIVRTAPENLRISVSEGSVMVFQAFGKTRTGFTNWRMTEVR